MPVYCPDCDSPLNLPRELISNGVAKVRCSGCGCRYAVLPDGTTLQVATSSGGNLAPGATPNSADRDGASMGSSDVLGPNFSEYGPGPQAPSGFPENFPALAEGTVFRGKWRIESEIGRGGTAVVYRARDLDTELDVALKVVGAFDGGGLENIRRAWAEEFKARIGVGDGRYLLRLESPVQESHDGVTYVALPQELGGQTLRTWLDSTRHDLPNRQSEGLRLFGQVCRGIEALHAANLAHLDLKPENVVLVTESPSTSSAQESIIAKVGDFGLARAGGSLRRREGTGTPAYMAPEQVRTGHEKEIGPRSDIYALGCILFEILDGDPPFSGTAEEMREKHLSQAPRDMEDIQAHLEKLAQACLAKKRKERPASVSAIRQALELDPAEESAWAAANSSPSEARLQDFLNQWPTSRHVAAAKAALLQAQTDRREREAMAAREAEDHQFAEAKRAGSEAVWRTFLAAFPDGRHVKDANEHLGALLIRIEEEKRREEQALERLEARARREREEEEARRRSEAQRHRAETERSSRAAKAAEQRAQEERSLREQAERQQREAESAHRLAEKQRREDEERREKERRERRAREEAERNSAQARAKAEAETRARAEAAAQRRRILEPVDIHGWTSERVRDRQRTQADALSMPVVFCDALADGSAGPAMVFIPSGSFVMGSPTSEESRAENEGPQRRVQVAAFAIGRTAVTFAQYDRFATVTERERPGDEDWGRGDRPVIHVSWEDAGAYAEWLSFMTGHQYRLPSEAEWEYAGRAGTRGPYNFDGAISPAKANYLSSFTYGGSCPDSAGIRWQTVPAGSLPANPWGLHEVHGNVLEWVADCWHNDYRGAPTTGGVWAGGDSGNRSVRGGSWANYPGNLRSAHRGFDLPMRREKFMGFRLARTLHTYFAPS